MARWSVPINSYVEAAKGDLRKAARAVTLELYSRILIRSPVDTGRFRGNWMIGVEIVPRGFDELKFNPSALPDGDQVRKLRDLELGATIRIRNNLPYAVSLEQGSSRQAPAGVVRVTAEEFATITRQVSLRVKTGGV